MQSIPYAQRQKTEKLERNAQIAVLAAAGIPYGQIAATFGITRQRVYYISRQRGHTRRDWGPGRPADRAVSPIQVRRRAQTAQAARP
jgi:Homeodomain-like domain